ncbi:uncharacterized protein LOC126618876 isoform X2 [Malus sylvestris]|uniref:uncharacterized protein isoform X1 n=1 Tax=Malus domestica TaxID=3750 RepID=UPI0010AAC35E|nr:uncharacterized protein LOC103431270 isoform X1 [Malus domestica]XP_050143041.1 uncharacterized protein LOC126618876 isoform X2 [Malus sylvestris]
MKLLPRLNNLCKFSGKYKLASLVWQVCIPFEVLELRGSSRIKFIVEAPGQVYSLPLGFGRVRPAASQPYPSAGVHGLPEAIGQLHSPHLAFERARPAASHSYPSAGVHRCCS